MNLGYACICLSLGKDVSTNRSMIKRTFLEWGDDYVSELTLKNANDLLHILKWNNEHDIKFFRMSSGIIPWGEFVDIPKLKDYNQITNALKRAGDFADANGIRLTAHPGPFAVLTSPREGVVNNTIAELELHGMIFDMIGLSQTPYNKINIHCNGVYGDKKSAMDRFIQNFNRLSPSVQSRLTVENDDKSSMYSVKDLMYIHERIGIPIVFDYHHHLFNTGGLTEDEAVKLAASTWPVGIKPVMHYSESRSLHEVNDKVKPQAHSDYINTLPETYGFDFDLMIESKKKEQTLFPFLVKEKVA